MVDEKAVLDIFEHYFEGSQDIIQRGRYSFSDIEGQEGELNILGNVTRRWGLPMTDGMWPIQFGAIHGDVDMSNSGLYSLEGSPREVYGNMSVANNWLKSIQGVTQTITAQLDISDNNLTTLEGLPPNQSVKLSWRKDLPLLRLLTCKWIEFDYFQMQSSKDSLEKRCLKILRKYQGQGKMALFDCQKDLEDAGFEENARW